MTEHDALNVKLANMKEDIDELKVDMKVLLGTIMTREHCREIQDNCRERWEQCASQSDLRAVKKLIWMIGAAVIAAIARLFMTGGGIV